MTVVKSKLYTVKDKKTSTYNVNSAPFFQFSSAKKYPPVPKYVADPNLQGITTIQGDIDFYLSPDESAYVVTGDPKYSVAIAISNPKQGALVLVPSSNPNLCPQVHSKAHNLSSLISYLAGKGVHVDPTPIFGKLVNILKPTNGPYPKKVTTWAGYTFEANPAWSVWTNADNSIFIAVSATQSWSKYLPTGNTAYSGPALGQKATDTKLVKAGFFKVADGVQPLKKKIDYTSAHTVALSKGWAYSLTLTSPEAIVSEVEKIPGNLILEFDNKYDTVVFGEVVTVKTNGLIELKALPSYKLLTASQKRKITKVISTLEFLAVVHNLSVEFKNADEPLSDELIADLAWAKAVNPNFNAVSTHLSHLQKHHADLVWLKKANLPYNIFKATPEQLKQTVAENISDPTLVEFFSDENIKEWVFAHFKVPNYSHSKANIEAYVKELIALNYIAVLAENSPNKPAKTNQVVWDFVNSIATSDSPLIDSFFQSAKYYEEGMENGSGLSAAINVFGDMKDYYWYAPINVRKLLSYAAKMFVDNAGAVETLAQEIGKATSALIEQKKYEPVDAKMWITPSGEVKALPPGSKVYEWDNALFLFPEGFEVGLKISSSSPFTHINKNYVADQTPLYVCPKELNYALAIAEGQTFTEVDLNAVDAAEKETAWTNNLPEASAAYYFKHNVKSLDNKYKVLTPILHQLPVGIKQLAQLSSLYEKTGVLDAILWKFNYGHYPITKSETATVNKAVKDTAKLELTPIDKSLGGMHSKQVYVDPLGDEWMGKFFHSDPNAKYRVDAEHYANVIGRLFGFRSPQTFVREMGGHYMYVQHIDPAVSNLSKHTPDTLTWDQLATAMQEHVLDWLIGNHDSYYGNLLVAPGKKAVFGIDKGQAFKHIHDDKLAAGYLPPENPIPVWYDQFYYALRDGKIDAEKANFIARRVLLKAYQVQSQHSERYRALVEAALEKRNFWPSKYSSREAFIAACMSRKEHLVDDFFTLYSQLFESAGIACTVDVNSFGARIGDAYVQNSFEFAEDVFNTNAYGKALFFNSRDFDECHIMFSPMHQKNGGLSLLGFARIHSSADDKLVTWLKSKVNGKLAYGAKGKASVSTSSSLPYVSEFHEHIVAYAKTLATHAKDKQFNTETISQAQSYAVKMASFRYKVLQHREEKPTELFKTNDIKFVTLEQRDAWVDAVEQKLSEFNLLEVAYSKKVSIKSAFPKQPNFEPVFYTPTKGLKNNGGTVEAYKLSSGNTVERTADNGHILSDWSANPGKHYWISAQEFAALKAVGEKIVWNKNVETLSKKQEEFTEESGSVQEVGKKLIVTHRAAAIHGGQLEFNTGRMVEKSTQSTKMQTGYEFSVEYGNVTIQYRPFKEQGVAKSQQGQLQFQVRDWLGDDSTIDDVLDTLSIMGLDVTPADAESLELYYWRHLTEAMSGFADATSGTRQKVLSNVSDASDMTTSQELEMFKAAWVSGYGASVVEKACWQPQFSPQYGEIGGKPSWLRPDFSVAKLRKVYGVDLPIHSVYGGNDFVARVINILRNAKILPTEERMRVLGYVYSGMSSSSDQSHGSSNYVFTRQNFSHFTGGTFVLNPLASLRTTNYAFNNDNFGNIDAKKKSAYFDPTKTFSMSNSGNELMIRNDCPVFAYVASDYNQKADIINKLTKEGITEIAGRSLNDWVFTSNEWQNAKTAKVNALWESLEKREAEGWC